MGDGVAESCDNPPRRQLAQGVSRKHPSDPRIFLKMRHRVWFPQEPEPVVHYSECASSAIVGDTIVATPEPA